MTTRPDNATVTAVLTEAAMRGVGFAKWFCPVDTGRLQASIRVLRAGPRRVDYGSDVEYAGFVELGTVKQSPNPYLRRSALALMEGSWR